jgi:hypothetical protein
MAMSEFDDELLMAELRLQEAAEPISEVSLELARAAFDTRTMDAELAALTRDSWSADEPAPALRAEGEPRSVTLEGPGLTLELDIETSAAGRQLSGYVIPAQELALVRADGQRVALQIDARGRFEVALAGGGSVKFVTASVETDWFLI